MRKYLWWAVSDALTKIGGGIIGGAMVSYFFNLSFGKTVDLGIYYIFLGLGLIALIAGYLGIRAVKNLEKPF